MAKIWINGKLLDEWDAVISIKDRGFRFGDGIFETIRVQNGRPYQLHFHLDRLQKGLAALRINCDVKPLITHIPMVISGNSADNNLLRISISRGIGSLGYMPTHKSEATQVMEMLKAGNPKTAVSLCTSRFEKISPKALPTHCKTSNGLNSILARIEATENQYFDSILLNANKEIVETSSANLFFVKNNRLFTPSLETGALSGATRAAIFRLSVLPVEEGFYTMNALQNADEVFLTNTAWGVLPVEQIDKQYFFTDHTIALQLQNHLENDINHATTNTSVA